MKKTVIPAATPTTCDPEALYLKAQRYVQHMSALDSDDWEYALWSGFCLEFLARAALANVSPALLAETDKSWASLYHALGFNPIEERFTPKSIAVSEVFKRLLAILPDFTKEHEALVSCTQAGAMPNYIQANQLSTESKVRFGSHVFIKQVRFFSSQSG